MVAKSLQQGLGVKMRALIIGGGGFIGHHLASRVLADECEIDLLDIPFNPNTQQHLKSLAERRGVNFIPCDLLSHSEIQLPNNYTHIFHFAAILGVQNVIDNPAAVLDKNVLLLQNAIKIAKRQKKLKCFIFSSTSEVYAGGSSSGQLQIPTAENIEIILPELKMPRSTYAISKLYGEAMCLHSGLPFQILRPHNVFGQRMGFRHVIPQLFERAAAEDSDNLGVHSANHTRAFCFIDDAVEMIWRLSNSSEALGEVINIGNQDDEISIKNLAEKIVRLLGKNLRINTLPTTEGSPSRRCPDMRKCIALTEFKPRVNIDKGLSLYYDWSKNIRRN